MNNNRRGFTIIELLVVISIIGLLSTISIVALNGARQKSRDAKRVGDAKQIQTALELYFNDNLKYPVSGALAGADLVLGGTSAKVLCDGGFVASNNATNCPQGKIYMGLVPANPTPNGIAYTYSTPDLAGSTYTLELSLEETTGGVSSGVHTVTPSGMQ